MAKAYLVLYNALSAAAWSVVLARTLSLVLSSGPASVHPNVHHWLSWTQTMAVLEIFHSLFGIVRSPLFTTVTQVSSRLLLVWAIIHPFPALALYPTYSSMLVAWSVAEVIRYSFFALGLAGSQPAFLAWLRYNTFFVLYPVGILSECSLVYLAAKPAAVIYGPLAAYALYAVLVVYVPGSYVLYTHMMSQRRKVMRSRTERQAKDQ